MGGGGALLDIVSVALDTPCFLWSLVRKKNTFKIYSAFKMRQLISIVVVLGILCL